MNDKETNDNEVKWGQSETHRKFYGINWKYQKPKIMNELSILLKKSEKEQ